MWARRAGGEGAAAVERRVVVSDDEVSCLPRDGELHVGRVQSGSQLCDQRAAGVDIDIEGHDAHRVQVVHGFREADDVDVARGVMRDHGRDE